MLKHGNLMTDRVTEFLTSGTPGWELSEEDFNDCSHTLKIEHPSDPILVQRGSRYYILNRDLIGKPKILTGEVEEDEVSSMQV